MAVVLGLVELIVPHLVTVWLSIAALVTAIFALFFPDALLVQFLIFLVITALLLLLTRPIAIRYFYRNPIEYKESIIGDDAIVVRPTNMKDHEYEVKVHGQRWIAVAVDADVFQAQEHATIVRKEGNKVYVVKKKEQKEY